MTRLGLKRTGRVLWPLPEGEVVAAAAPFYFPCLACTAVLGSFPTRCSLEARDKAGDGQDISLWQPKTIHPMCMMCLQLCFLWYVLACARHEVRIMLSSWSHS